MKETFNMGKIVNTHGVGGDVKIYPYAEDPMIFDELGYILIEGEGDKKFSISNIRVHKGMVLAKIKGYNNINDVLKFMEKNVYMLRSDVEDDSEGHYIVDLVGSEIVDESGEMIGVLLDVLQNTAQDLYEIKHKSGGVFLLPVVDEFVRHIDIEEGKIVVKLPEGLLE